MNSFGSDVSNYTYKKIFAELVWVRYDNNNNCSHCFPDMSSKLVRFLGEILSTNSKKPEFEQFVVEVLNNFSMDGKYNFEVKLQISKNMFDFLVIISGIELTQQLLLALGFVYSNNAYFPIIGKEFIISKLLEVTSENSKYNLKKIPCEDLEKLHFFLINSKFDLDVLTNNNNNTKFKNNQEQNCILNSSLNSQDTSQEKDINNNQEHLSKKAITVNELISKLSKIILSNDWSNQSNNIYMKFPGDENEMNEKDKDKYNINDISSSNFQQGGSQGKYSNNTNNNKKSFDIPTFTPCKDIHSEKLAFELGPSIMMLKKENIAKTKQKNGNPNLDIVTQNLFNFKIDERRLAELVIFMSNNYNYQEDKEQRLLQKLFLKNINYELGQQIEENLEKKLNLNWNIESFYKNNKVLIDSMNQNSFFDFFDHKDFEIKDKKSLENYTNILTKLNIPIHNIYKTLFKKTWENIDNQLTTLSYFLSNPSDILKHISTRTIKKNQSLNYDNSFIKNTTLNNYLVEVWSSLDIIEGILKLCNFKNIHKIKPLFDWPMTNIPENILLALLQIPKNDFLYCELLKEVFTIFIGNHINSATVFEDLWSIDHKRFIEVLIFLYRNIPDVVNLNKILDLSQKIKESVIPMVSSDDDNFSIWLATLAIKRDFLHIDQWIYERIEKRGDNFILALLDFIKQNVINEYRTIVASSSRNVNFFNMKDQILEKSQLTIEAISIIFEHLNFNTIQTNANVSKSTLTEIKLVYKHIFEIFDELHSHPSSSLETEKKANLIFRKLFNDETSLKSLTEQMKVFKESSNKKDNEVFACILHSMLDEYRFFSKYPDKELILMGSLFGQIIDLRLIDGLIESIALKYIIDGFKKQQGKLIIFSTKAIEQFIEKIYTWPLFFEELYKITRNFQGPLYEKIEEKWLKYVKVSESMGINHNPKIGASQTNYNLNTNPNNTNNMNQNNIPSKILNMQGMGNFIGMMPPNNIPKSSIKNNKFNTPNEQMLMNNMKNSTEYTPRGVTESNTNSNLTGNNFQVSGDNNIPNNIYGTIPSTIEKTQLNTNQMPFNPSNMSNRQLGNTKLNKELNYSTNITLIKKVYTSDVKFKENVGSKITALKNLAVSLSQVTLFKNKPLLSKDINIKEMLCEAYENGKLLIAINFVCKFLEQTPKSKIFHTKNPWVVDILTLLKEIHDQNYIIPQIISEIEELFKRLNLDITKYKHSKILHELKQPLNSSDFSNSQINQQQKHNLPLNNFVNNTDNSTNNDINNNNTNNNNNNDMNNNKNLVGSSGQNFNPYNLSNNVNKGGQIASFNNPNSNNINFTENNQSNNILNLSGIENPNMKINKNPIINNNMNTNINTNQPQNSIMNNNSINTNPLINTNTFNPINDNSKIGLTNVTNVNSNINSLYQPNNQISQQIGQNMLNINKTVNLNTFNFANPNSLNNNNGNVTLNSMNLNKNINNNQTTNTTNNMVDIKSEEIFNLFEVYNIYSHIDELCEQIKSQILNKELEKQVKYNKELNSNILNNDNMSKILSKALINAINQILFLVVERTVNISLITTRELTIKDFAFDSDAEKFKKAVMLSVKSLSGSLANVTCKDPLRQGLLSQIKELFIKNKLELILELVKVHSCIGKIIEVGCLYIRDYVISKSIEKVENDEIIIQECKKRESGEFQNNIPSEEKSNQNISKSNKNISSIQQKILNLPSFLQPIKNAGILPDPIKIYEEFDKIATTRE